MVLNPGGSNSMPGHRQRLDKRTYFQGYRLGKFMARKGRNDDSFAKTTRVCRQTEKSRLVAEVSALQGTRVACVVGEQALDCDSVTDLQRGHGGVDLCDGAGELVTEYYRHYIVCQRVWFVG